MRREKSNTISGSALGLFQLGRINGEGVEERQPEHLNQFPAALRQVSKAREGKMERRVKLPCLMCHGLRPLLMAAVIPAKSLPNGYAAGPWLGSKPLATRISRHLR